MDFQPNNTAIVHSSKGGSSRIHKTLSLDPTVAGLAKNYFGIDLAAIPTASDEELAEYADKARAAKELQEIIPILKKHFQELIDGQVAYEQFIADTQKEVAKAAKSIDKNVLDAWLNSQGYKAHVGIMGQKARNGILKLQAETRSAVNLEQMDFNVALQMIARRQQARLKEIQAKPAQAEQREQLAADVREQRQRRKDLLTYGSAASAPQKKGFWENMGDWFKGK